MLGKLIKMRSKKKMDLTMTMQKSIQIAILGRRSI